MKMGQPILSMRLCSQSPRAYNDYKAMDIHELIKAVVTVRPAYPDFRFGHRV
jgi:hypothetical protein